MALNPWRSRLRVAGIMLLVLCVLAGCVYSARLPISARYPDELEYLGFSNSLVHGSGYSMDGVHLTASRPPGYPFFLAAIQFLGGSVVAMRMVQYFVFGATILVVWQLIPGGQRFGGLLAATVVAMLYPVLFYTGATLYPQLLAGFLFMLSLALLLADRRTMLTDIASGIVFGALMLAVPTFALTLLVVLAVAWWLKIIRWGNGAVILVSAALIVSTWTARNWIVFHHIVPFASNSGENFLIGNNPTASISTGSGNVDISAYYHEAEERHLDEFQTDAYLKNVAFTWIEEHPGRAFVLYLEKTANFFNIRNEYSSSTLAEVSGARQFVLAATYLLLVGLVFWRLAESRRFPLLPREKLFLIVYVLTAFTSAIFFTRIRHRLPFDYLLITLAAMHVSRRLQLCFEPSATKST